MKDIFYNIYKGNLWGGKESVSGPGSSIFESQKLMDQLPHLFSTYEIKSILDAPCGDFHWMQHVPRQGVSYTGVDIVNEIIQNNTAKYANAQTRFYARNIVEDVLPCVDLIICRDCLVHLTYSQIARAISNFKRSGSTYLLTTHFPSVQKNREIKTGDWRPLNLCAVPFRFPKPLMMIRETTTIKTMSLWKLSDLYR